MGNAKNNSKITTVFGYISYKKFLRAYLQENRNIRGLSKKIAESAKCQPSYFSQALNTKIQLTIDQAYGITRFLNFSDTEKNYFLMMVEYERAVTKELAEYFLDKIKEVQKANQDIGTRLNKAQAKNIDFLATYYSNWIYIYIHILTSIPVYQKIEAIASKLNFSKELTLNFLLQLEKANLVIKEGDRWQHSGQQWHLEKDSVFIGLHHLNWRNQAVANSQLKSIDALHFSGLYTISKGDMSLLKEKILNYIKEINDTCLKSGSEEVVIFCCDLFTK